MRATRLMSMIYECGVGGGVWEGVGVRRGEEAQGMNGDNCAR